MKFKSKITKEILEKNKQKKENKPIIITVAITLAAVITLLATFIAGMKYQDGQSSQVEAKAASIVKNVQVKVSKE